MALAVAAAFAEAAGAQTLPTGGSTTAGSATISQSGAAMTINQTSQRAIIDWSTFNIGNGASVTFAQPGASSIAVNRVRAGGQSQIDGTLNANGNVWILNPNGVLFSSTASVNVAGLVASTGDINAMVFQNSTTAPIAITGATAGSVSNQGSITVTGAGLAAFVAPSVSNSGTITATAGRVVLAGAQAATVSLNGGLYEIAVDQGVANPSVANSGTLSAAGGSIVLSATDAANLVSGVINLSGVQQANTIEVDGDHVVLASDLNASNVAGSSNRVDVSGGAQIQDAVNIAATGGAVNVAAGTYAQTSTLNVGKSVALTGAGEALTTIDAHAVSGYGILVNADDVSLSGFTLDGPSANVSSSYGIKVQPAGSAASSRLHDFSISNVTSRGAGKAELDLNGVVGATIDYVTADGTPYGVAGGTTPGAGIQITDSANVTITNSTTRNNAWGGVALYQTNRFYDQQATNITIQSNNTFTEPNPLYLQRESTTLDYGALNLPGFAYAVGNTATIGTGASAVQYSQFTWMQPTAQGAFDLAVNLQSPGTSYVQGWSGTALTQSFDVGVGNLSGGGTQPMSIMAAIDRASPGALVNVFPGAYTETAANRTIPGVGGTYTLGLFLNKDNLTLRGVDANGNAITNANNVQAWITAGAATNFGMNDGVVANNVTVEGLGFKPYVANPNKTIEISGDNFTFRNSVVDNTSVTGGAGALYFGELDPAHQIEKLTVTGSKFLDGSVSLQNGVGVAADGATYQPAADRVISGNGFIGSGNYRFGGVLLTGEMDEIPWRPLPIGGATVAGNSFSGFDDSVLVRGAQQGVDLMKIMQTNTFDGAVLVTDPAGNPRGQLYASSPTGGAPFVMRPKYSIQSSIAAGLARAASGDTVTVGVGAYAENVVVSAPVNLIFEGATVLGLTVNAGGSGIGGSVTADGAPGLSFNAPVVLLGNTSLVTTGADIALNGDVQNAGVTSYALGLSAGPGNVRVASGGTQGNPLGRFSVASNDFTLGGALWVKGYAIDAGGKVSINDGDLHGTDPGSLNTIKGQAQAPTLPPNVPPSLLVPPPIRTPTDGGSSAFSGGGSGGGFGSTPPAPAGGGSGRNGKGGPPQLVTAPAGGGNQPVVQSVPSHAGDYLDRGMSVEIDLTPGNR